MEHLLKKPCKKCGGLEASSNRSCKQCDLDYLRNYREKNKDKVKTDRREYYKQNNTKLSKLANERSKTYVEGLPIAYVRRTVLQHTLKLKLQTVLTLEDIPEELIEVKRLQLQLTRLIRTQNL